MKIKEYKTIVEEQHSIEFVVNQAIKHGWQPIGGQCYCDAHDYKFTQVMVKYEEEIAKDHNDYEEKYYNLKDLITKTFDSIIWCYDNNSGPSSYVNSIFRAIYKIKDEMQRIEKNKEQP